MPLSTQGINGNQQWTSISSRGSRNTPSRFILQKPAISASTAESSVSSNYDWCNYDWQYKVLGPSWPATLAAISASTAESSVSSNYRLYLKDIKINLAVTNFIQDHFKQASKMFWWNKYVTEEEVSSLFLLIIYLKLNCS